MAKKTVTKKPSRLTEIYLAEKKAGRGLGSAVGKAALEKIDPRQFFNQKGLLANVLPSFFKTYKASTGTTSRPKTTSSLASVLNTSALENKVDALSEATRIVGMSSRITAKNTLVLPMIARDMNLMRQNIFKLVKSQTGLATNKSDMFFLQAAGRELAYESKFRKERSFSPTANRSSVGGTSVLGELLKTGIGATGSLLGGVASGVGSLFGGLSSVVGGVISGIGGFLGGAARGIFSAIGGALSGAGLIGIIAAAGVGYILYKMYESLDFSEIKKSLGLDRINFGNISFESITKDVENIVENLRKRVDELTGGGFSKTLKSIEDTFKDVAIKTIAVAQTGMQIMTNVFAAALKDFQGFSKNIFEENKGPILAGIAALGTLHTLGIGAFTPKGALVLAGVSALAGSYGYLTKEKTLPEMESELRKTESELQKREQDVEKTKQYIANPPSGAQPANIQARRNALIELEEKIIPGLKKSIDEQKSGIEEKKSRTGNLQLALNQAANPTELYERNLSKLRSPTPYTPPGVPTGVSQSMRDIVGQSEGGAAGYDASFRFGKVGGDPSIPKKYGGKTLSQLSIGEVLEYSKSRKENEGAVGKYGFMPSTLESLLGEAKLTKSDTFSAANQDKLYDILTRRNSYILQRYGIEPTPRNLHLAHVVGPGSVSKLLSPENQSKNALDVLGFDRNSSVAKTNPQLNQTVSDYVSSITTKYNNTVSPAPASPVPTPAPVTPTPSVPNTSSNATERINSSLNIDGNRVSGATIDVAQARIQIGSAPIVVAPPTVNVQAPQIQGGTGGFGAMASSSVVDTEFMKLLVGRTVTL